MPLRTILLRVMLWSLGVAAATGVLAVLALPGDLPWRVVGTGITTAFACALMLPTSGLVDRKDSRAAGLLGMAGIVLEFIMALMLIWEAPRYLFAGLWDEEEIALTMLVFGLAVPLIMGLLQLERKPHGFLAGRVGIIVTLATFVAFLLAIWTPYRSYRIGGAREVWAKTGGALFLFGALAAVTLAGLGAVDRRSWRLGGIASGVVACTMWLLDIWIGAGSDLGFVIFCVLLSLACVVAHAHLCSMCPVTPDQQWVRVGTIAATVVTAILIDSIIADERLFNIATDYNVLGRFSAAAGIVAGCGSLALCVLARINRKVEYEQLSPELTEVTVVCPRCRKKQAVRIGGYSRCSACSLRILVRIEEPRCPTCDYLLYGLTSDRCPECGTPVSTQVSRRQSNLPVAEQGSG